jgi:hypothetical protein
LSTDDDVECCGGRCEAAYKRRRSPHFPHAHALRRHAAQKGTLYESVKGAADLTLSSLPFLSVFHLHAYIAAKINQLQLVLCTFPLRRPPSPSFSDFWGAALSANKKQPLKNKLCFCCCSRATVVYCIFLLILLYYFASFLCDLYLSIDKKLCAFFDFSLAFASPSLTSSASFIKGKETPEENKNKSQGAKEVPLY